MNVVDFHKERAEYLIDCIANGKPIEPSTSAGWTYNDMLALAGACHFGALSHGRVDLRAMKGEEEARQWLESLPKEHREANEEMWFNDVAAAIEFYSHLTMLVKDGKYDHQAEKHLVAFVSQVGSSQKRLHPLKGFKSAN